MICCSGRGSGDAPTSRLILNVRLGVKPGNARGEQMFSALLPNSDIDVWHL